MIKLQNMIKLIFQKKNVYNFSKVKNYFNFFPKIHSMFQVYANEIDEKTYERKRHHWKTRVSLERGKRDKKKIYLSTLILNT